LLQALPLTPNGKVDRKALAGIEESESPERERLVPRGAVEEITAGIWKELLKLETVAFSDNFFELGGHSLLATRMVSRVKDVFHIEIPVRALFEDPTLSGLATRIDRAISGGPKYEAIPITPVSRLERIPLSFSQERLWVLDQMEPGSAAYNIPGG